MPRVSSIFSAAVGSYIGWKAGAAVSNKLFVPKPPTPIFKQVYEDLGADR